MRVNREAFLKVLQDVSAGLTLKDEQAQSSCFLFLNGRVFTFQEKICCSAPSPLGDFTGAVAGAELSDLLSKLPDTEIEVTPRPDKTSGKIVELFVQSGDDRRSGIRMEAEITSKVGVVESPTDWKPLSEKFSKGVEIVNQCASRSDNKYAFTCVHITPKFVEACDRKQLARYPVDVPISENILIPADALSKMAPMGMIEICETPNWLHFRNKEGVVYSCLRFMDTYNSLDALFDKTGGKRVQLPTGLEEVLAKTNIFTAANSAGNSVRIDLMADKIIIKGQGPRGWHQEKKKLTFMGDPISFIISAKMLLAITKRSTHCCVTSNRLLVDTEEFSFGSGIVDPAMMQGTEKKEEPKAAK